MILVTGASSAIGKETARLLTEADIPVRCMSRNLDAAHAVAPAGSAAWVTGDFGRPVSLLTALRGVDACLLLCAAGERQVELETNFIEEARHAGIKHLVKVSALGAAHDALFAAGRSHAEIEDRVERAGISFTHVRPHFFMQNFLRFADMIRGDSKFVAAMGDARISLVDAQDVGAVCAALLRDGVHRERRIAVTGPQALSFGEIATVMSELLGRRINYVNAPEQSIRENMTRLGRPAWVVDNVLGLQAAYRTGRWEETTQSVDAITGRKANTFAAFFQRHIAQFQ